MRQKTAAETAPAPSAVPTDLDHEMTRGFTARYVRQKSRQLVGHAGLREFDSPDIEQELLLEVWKALPNFESEAGDWRSFVATVVERQAAQILIHRRSEKRQLDQDLISLDMRVTDEDDLDVSLASQILPRYQSAVTGSESLSELEQAELRIDLETLLEGLSELDIERMSELGILSQAAAASELSVSRRTVRCLLERVRERCDKKN